MKKLFRSRWTRLTLALCMSMVLLSTAAYAAEDTTGGGTSASVISAFLLCLSLLLGLISPKLEARAFAFAPPAVAAVAAAFLGACGLKVVVDGMDREGLQDAMYKLLKEFLDTELGGITIEEWLGSAWDMTVTLGKIFLGHSLADKLNAFAQWVAGKYGAQVGENEVYNEQISFFPDGTQLIFGFLPKDDFNSISFPENATVFLMDEWYELITGYKFGIFRENSTVYLRFIRSDGYSGSTALRGSCLPYFLSADNYCIAKMKNLQNYMPCVFDGDAIIRSSSFYSDASWFFASNVSIDRAPSMSYVPELEADQGIALDVGAAGTMDENAVLQGVLDDVLAGELAVLPAPRLSLRDKLLHELWVLVRKMKKHWKK